MSIQRGILRPLRKHQGELLQEIIADVQYFAFGEAGEIMDGRVFLNIKSVQPANENEIIEEGDYDFLPVTPGLCTVGSPALTKRKWRVALAR